MLNGSNLQVQVVGVEDDGREVKVWLRKMGAMK